MQTDPIGYEDQVNLYAYVGNDPGNMVDPSGKCGIATPACIILAEKAAEAVVVGIAVVTCIFYCNNDDLVSRTEGQPVDFEDTEDKYPPFQGEPGSTVRGEKQSTTYGEDTYPAIQRDNPHHGCGDHCHDWEQSEDGSPPTERSGPRDPVPGDPPPPRGQGPILPQKPIPDPILPPLRPRF